MTERPQQKTNPAMFIQFNKLLTRNAAIYNKPFVPHYFPCNPLEKDPVPGLSWKKNRKTFDEALALMEAGYNIGIAGMDDDDLCIVDVDDMNQIKLSEVKPTLSAVSRKRIGRHYYYFSSDRTAKKNIATGDAGELRSNGQYVLAPGSYVPCGAKELARMPAEERVNAGCYTILSFQAPADITFAELPLVYRARYYQKIRDQKEAERKAAERKNRKVPQIIKYKSALWDLTITDVSGVPHTGYRKIPMPSEIHGSETGHNCSVNEGLLHCWRHCVAHSAMSYLAVLAGVSTCERAGKPHGGGSFGIDYQDGYTIFECWKYAKERGMIPEDDPIPHAALVYYALSKGLCVDDDIVDGRLPDFIYSITPVVAKIEGMNFGRQ